MSSLIRPGKADIVDWLVLLSLLVYANAIPNRLVYDDYPSIINNDLAHGVSHAKAIFSGPSWWPPSMAAKHFRPLTTLTFAANYSLHGLNPVGYHLVNNILHGLVAWLLYLVLLVSGLSGWAALAAAVLFVTHPLHTEAVYWGVGRAEMMAVGFLLATLYCHARARSGGVPWRVGAVICFVLGALSKETGYLAPVVLLVWDLLVGGIVERPRRGFTRAAVAEYAVYGLLLAGFAWHRSVVVGGATATLVTPMNSPLIGATGRERLLTGGYVISRYLGLLVWPATLSVDYSPNQITRVTQWADPRATAAVAALGFYALTTALLCWRHRVLGFVFVMVAIVFAPGSNLPFPVGTTMAERLMYLPCAVICVPLGCLLGWLAERAGRPKLALGLLVALSTAYGVRTFIRGFDWRDEVTLFGAAYRVSPRSSMANKNYGAALQIAGRNAEAVPLLQRSVQILWPFPDAHYFLGVALKELNRTEEAAQSLQDCVGMAWHHTAAHLQLGECLVQLHRPAEAAEHFAVTVAQDAGQERAWYRRAQALALAGQAAPASAALAEAVARYPSSGLRTPTEHEVQKATAGAPANRTTGGGSGAR